MCDPAHDLTSMPFTLYKAVNQCASAVPLAVASLCTHCISTRRPAQQLQIVHRPTSTCVPHTPLGQERGHPLEVDGTSASTSLFDLTCIQCADTPFQHALILPTSLLFPPHPRPLDAASSSSALPGLPQGPQRHHQSRELRLHRSTSPSSSTHTPPNLLDNTTVSNLASLAIVSRTVL